MTEEEKKEFEEFLQWKKEKAEKDKAQEQTVNTEGKVEEVTKPGGDTVDSSTPTISEAEKTTSAVVPIILGFLAIIILFVILGTCSHRTQKTESDVLIEDADSIAEIVDDVLVADPEPSTKTWDFTIKKDPMTDTNNIWATIQSDDYIRQDFPYEGYTYASITIRYMKKYGYDVLVQITKGQINGRSYYGTDYVSARFDDGSAKKYYFDEAADGSSDHVFLRNSKDFINKCKKAKDIKIDIPIYQSGRPAFSFHVDEPLVWREE